MIILTQDGKSVKVGPQPFASEHSLQQYISANPSAIPLGGAPGARELHVLGREFPTRCGPLDVLGTDVDAHPYIIETKLHKNPDKRLVIAQILDYGAALWAAEPSADYVIDHLRADAVKRNAQDPIAALAAFLDGDEQAAFDHIARLCDSLAAGKFTAIVLMDQLSDALRDLILFMNENSAFRLLAVELEYYQHGPVEIAYPKLFGSETRSPAKRGSRHSIKLDPEQYLLNYAERLGKDATDQWQVIADSLLRLPGVSVGHLPGGCPYLYLNGTPRGDVRLFRMAHHVAELRDLLNLKDGVFELFPQLGETRAQFRNDLMARVPGAYVGGTIGRVYIPLASAVLHTSDIGDVISQLDAALRNSRVATLPAAGA